jgi:hypothetical protein
VVLAQGSFRHGALCHRLDLVKAEDLRTSTARRTSWACPPFNVPLFHPLPDVNPENTMRKPLNAADIGNQIVTVAGRSMPL